MEDSGGVQYRIRRFDPRGIEFDYIYEEVSSANELLERLNYIEENETTNAYSPSAMIFGPNGDRMRVGLGGAEWVLWYLPSFGGLVMSEGESINDEETRPFLAHQLEDVLLTHLIPRERARRVLLRWLETGTVTEEMNPAIEAALEYWRSAAQDRANESI